MCISLTVEAVLAQVLLDLLGREAAVLGDAKVGQDIARLFDVCVLHPRWIGEASVEGFRGTQEQQRHSHYGRPRQDGLGTNRTI